MNEERVFRYICDAVTIPLLKEMAEKGKVGGITATDIEKALNINRNNASTLLNKLVKKRQLIKIDTRPVYFLPRKAVEEFLNKVNVLDVYTAEEFVQQLHQGDNPTDPFSMLIGYDSSLKYQVEQAKAAILYPPNGLHTLITGESGTGKSLFAKIMHQFGLKERGLSENEFPFVEFNCADYFNNPQLLMSQLFGHVRGAFTGANEDKVGLVEKANNGILFLDEVHRLPPEGQEMLFFLIDTNRFHRLGEINNIRQANVLIIAATTENPQRALLRTFIRRIPILIQMPSVREKSMRERIALIEHLFAREAAVIKHELVISPEVIKALATLDCPGNIGQLTSEVKLLCARAFLECQEPNDVLEIGEDKLTSKEKSEENKFKTLSTEDQKILQNYNTEIVVKPTSEIAYLYRRWNDDRIYNSLREHLQIFTASGLSKEEINKHLSKEIETYYQHMIRRFTHKKVQMDDLYKLVGKGIVDFAMETIEYASQRLNIKYSKKSIFGFAFHIKYLLEQVKQRKLLTEKERQYIKKEYVKEFAVAKEIIGKLEANFCRTIPDDETYFITLLLANTTPDEVESSNTVSIMVITHGDSIASSMASVANSLLGTDLILAVDMPLDKSIEETYQETLQAVRMLDHTKGIILLVDMGSLTSFGMRITKDTGIPTKTIANVSTPLLLEVTRNALFKNLSLDEICQNSLATINQINLNYPPKKPQAVLSVCVTGEGVSKAFKNMLEEKLAKSNLDHIKVFAMEYMEVKNNSPTFARIMEDYELVACIGNVNPKLPVPFIHIERLLSRDGVSEVLNALEMVSKSNQQQSFETFDDVYKESEALLIKYLTYLNPHLAIRRAKSFIEALDLKEIKSNRALQVSLPLHLGFMLERKITGEEVQFPKQDHYIQNNFELYTKIKSKISILTEGLNVNITDADICFLILAIIGS